MKRFLHTLAVLLLSFSLTAQQKNQPLLNRTSRSSVSATSADESWYNNARNFIASAEYAFRKKLADKDQFYCSNKTTGLYFLVNNKKMEVSPLEYSNHSSVSKWNEHISFNHISKGNSLFAGNEYSCITSGNTIRYDYKNYVIEFNNSDKGLRQNFIIKNKLAGNQNLEVSLSVSGNMKVYTNESGAAFSNSEDSVVFYYRDLNVWDAQNKKLPAHMELRKQDELVIVVDDKEATYPITIDPISQTPEWTTSADGILPTLIGQTAVDAAYGFSVTGLGDINADGYDDVAIGAPACTDIFSGSGALANVGAVFVYCGSNNGLPTSPNYVLQPSACVAGALFGYSIAGGDINNDGKNDIIVGAPADQVTIPWGVNQTSSGTTGKVYTFNGATLTSSTSPFTTLQLSGNNIIDKDVNLSVNALFGFSVAVTEDLNGDSKKDIIIGSPTYAGIKTNLFGQSILDVQSGGAFVYLSSAGDNNTTIVKLEPIKQSLLGLGLLNNNINGLLFGYAVDGTSDYNNDGNPDVVATAPAGIDLSSISGLLNGKLLQGSAEVYYGTGSGINSNAGAVLSASSGGLLTNLTGTVSNIANLFGLSVKGARNAAGQRTGNILVGAPLGGTLMNVLNLQLKTGTVSVFKKQNSSPAGYVSPDQVISSPRNSNTILELVQSNLLFGFSLDNVFDVNCDGIGDIIVGEPASSSAQLVNANVAGGAAYVYLGQANGTYTSEPLWTLTAYEDTFLGANATSLIGYSVAGVGKTKGVSNKNRILVGSPSRTLDFGSGLLNLGSTLGTLFSLAAGDNGVGKAYVFETKLCPTNGSLPVKMSNLTGAAQNNQTHLSWNTYQEIDNSYFDIERSVDGINFTSIGLVNGKGNSNSAINYSFNDVTPYAGDNYYRLRIVDYDGSYSYSNVVRISNSNFSVEFSTFYPNPFRNKIDIIVNCTSESKATIVLYDNTGNLVVQKHSQCVKGLNKFTVDNLSGLSSGIYLIKVITGNDIFSKQVVK